MSNERDELAQVIHSRICEENLDDCLEWRGRCVKAAESAISAGYRKLRTITTKEELDALPVGSVVKFDGPEFSLVAVKHWESKYPRKDGTPLSEWLATGYEDAFETEEIDLPTVVLWEPEA